MRTVIEVKRMDPATGEFTIPETIEVDGNMVGCETRGGVLWIESGHAREPMLPVASRAKEEDDDANQ